MTEVDLESPILAAKLPSSIIAKIDRVFKTTIGKELREAPKTLRVLKKLAKKAMTKERQQKKKCKTILHPYPILGGQGSFVLNPFEVYRPHKHIPSMLQHIPRKNGGRHNV